MTRPIHLAVFGTPAPMGSKRAYARNGHAWVVDDKPNTLRDWQRLVAQAASDWIAEAEPLAVIDEPVRLDVEFFLPRPPSVPRWRVWPDRKPDCSKLLRAVEDPLTGLLWTDDSRVVMVGMTKRYADTRPPGVDITITPLGAQLSPRAARLLSEEG